MERRRRVDVNQLMQQTRDALTVSRLFGEPLERNGVTVIPVAVVRGGGGGGQGEGSAPRVSGPGLALVAGSASRPSPLARMSSRATACAGDRRWTSTASFSAVKSWWSLPCWCCAAFYDTADRRTGLHANGGSVTSSSSWSAVRPSGAMPAPNRTTERRLNPALRAHRSAWRCPSDRGDGRCRRV